MEINTFWKIVLKGIGLWLLLKCFEIIPQFFSHLSFSEGNLVWDTLIILWLANIAILVVLILIVRVFLFKTQWIINVLKLDKHFTEQRIDVNISGTKLLSIVTIIIGALIFLQGIPLLFSELLKLLSPKENTNEILQTTDAYWTIYHFIRTLAGLLIMTNSKFIVNLIDKQAKNDYQ